jgi:aryl-alcohol dehydrogenase-like predicted oxidoreductase
MRVKEGASGKQQLDQLQLGTIAVAAGQPQTSKRQTLLRRLGVVSAAGSSLGRRNETMAFVTRRQFLQTASSVGVAVTAGGVDIASADDAGKLPMRVLGKTKVRTPILGLGTVAVGALKTEKEAHELINKAIDLGVTFIDTAPAFAGYGKAQTFLKGVLKERRNQVFVATKCLRVAAADTLDLLKKNLDELGIEQADLVYAHAVGHDMYKLDQLLGNNGTLAGLEKARKDGLCRFVGLTGHNRPEKFVQILEKRCVDVMMNAVNIVDRHTYAFEEIVWPAARKQDVGLIAMKVFGGSILEKPCKMPEELRHASFRYALSIDGVALSVIGMGTLKELEQNVEWAKNFKPLTADEARELKEKTVALAKQWGVHLDLLDPQGEKKRPLINT